MPTLKKRQSRPEGDQSEWFVVTSGPNHPFTFQLKPEGYRWLLNSQLGHESNIDWDVFETLRSLDLLYTLNSSYAPSDAPPPDDLSLEEIPPEQRVQLANELLAKFSATELNNKEGTLRFLLSFGNLDWLFQQPILETILSGTPFEPSVVADYDEAFEIYGGGSYESPSNYNPILLALVIDVLYDAIEPVDDEETINEGHPIWVYDDWIVYEGTELIFYEINNIVVEALPDLLNEELSETSESMVGKDDLYSFLISEFSALSSFQFTWRAQDLNPSLGVIIADGLVDRNSSILIVPRVETEANGPFKYSDELDL